MHYVVLSKEIRISWTRISPILNDFLPIILYLSFAPRLLDPSHNLTPILHPPQWRAFRNFDSFLLPKFSPPRCLESSIKRHVFRSVSRSGQSLVPLIITKEKDTRRWRSFTGRTLQCILGRIVDEELRFEISADLL